MTSKVKLTMKGKAEFKHRLPFAKLHSLLYIVSWPGRREIQTHGSPFSMLSHYKGRLLPSKIEFYSWVLPWG